MVINLFNNPARGVARLYGVTQPAFKALTLLLLLVFAPVSTAAQTITIAALGDSLTQGYGLPVQDGLVPQLQAWLDDQGADIKLLNAGVSGDTTRGGLSRVGWTLTPDVDALIVALGGNDILRGIDPAFARENLAGILDVAAARDLPVLLVGLKAPSNFGTEYQAAFDALYPDLAADYDVLFYENLLAEVIDSTDPTKVTRRHMQPDNIHPDAVGVKLIVQAFGPSVKALADAVR